MFLGPIGSLIPLPGLPPSLRAYYLLLVPGIALALSRRADAMTFKRLMFVLPAICYVLASAVWATFFYSSDLSSAEGGSPAVRACLFVALLLFFICTIGKYARVDFFERSRLIGIFLKGYAISLVAGYILFIGYSMGALTGETVAMFQILFQTSFAGLMRFSPGSYPNEYGVVSSFVLATLVVLLLSGPGLHYFFPASRNPFRLRLVMSVLALLTLGALFLSTTRAAYVSFILSMLYLVLASGSAKTAIKHFLWICLSVAALIVIAQQFYDVIAIFVGGYDAFFDGSSSTGERYTAWAEALDEFASSPMLGTGFGTLDMIHNVYLQLLFGLGMLGSAVWLYSTVRLLWSLRQTKAEWPEDVDTGGRQAREAFRRISHIGIVHVTWFAMGNHNLNHFLTWFVLLLVAISPRRPPKRRRAMQSSVRASTSLHSVAGQVNGPELI